ncbi:YdgA family protein [Haemophilus sp. SZY H57]|uniref:YdgA family protein n=1 Tax=unclassified Haemophilus TaxID=2609962 RepID=UPI0025AF01F2|nr:YdgA family protein [Haemophilus sp. SZY H51]MDN3212388.1 YdgA family protein [Haemophilus sp. SZY H51]
MKKSTVALGVIMALGAVGVGGAWFTGEKAQTEYLRQIELANKQAQALGSSDLFKVVYQNKQFERGFFTSQVEDEVVISLPKEGKVFTIPFSTKLYHGPFPLNQLEKFNFVPTMFSAQGVIGKNETTQPLFDLLKSDKPVQYQATTSYNLSTKGKVELAGGELTDPESPGTKVTWSNINMGFDVNKDLAGKYDMTLNEVSATVLPEVMEEQDGEDMPKSITMKMKGMKVEGSYNPTKWAYIYTGKSTSLIDSFEMATLDHAGKESTVVEKGFKAKSDISLDGDFVSAKSENTVDSIAVDGKDFGKLTYNGELNHIEANAANALIEALFTVFKSVSDDKNVKNEVVSEILSSWVENHGMVIFNNQPQIKLNPVSISDNQGKVSLDLNVALAKDPKFDLMAGSLYKQFTDFAVNIHVDKATAEKIMTQFAPEEDKALVKEKIEEQAKQAAAQNIVVNNDKNVTLTLVLEKGELKLNGQLIPEEQVQGVLFMLIMGAAMQTR